MGLENANAIGDTDVFGVVPIGGAIVHPRWWRLQPTKGNGCASPRRAPPTKKQPCLSHHGHRPRRTKQGCYFVDPLWVVASSWTLCGWLLLRGPFMGGALCGLTQPLPFVGWSLHQRGCMIAPPIGTTPKISMSPIAFAHSNPISLLSCNLHALLSAAHILLPCLLECIVNV